MCAVDIGWIGIPEEFPGLGGILPNLVHQVSYTLLPAGSEMEGLPFNIAPLLTSIGVAGLGLLLGWAVYRRSAAGELDPLKKLLGPVHTLLENKYYFDELYDIVFVRPSIWFSETFTYLWMDRGLIDGILHTLARLAFSLGGIFKNRFELPVISGGADAIGSGFKIFGRNFRMIQSGRIQEYLTRALAAVVLIAALFYLLLQ